MGIGNWVSTIMGAAGGVKAATEGADAHTVAEAAFGDFGGSAMALKGARIGMKIPTVIGKAVGVTLLGGGGWIVGKFLGETAGGAAQTTFSWGSEKAFPTSANGALEKLTTAIQANVRAGGNDKEQMKKINEAHEMAVTALVKANPGMTSNQAESIVSAKQEEIIERETISFQAGIARQVAARSSAATQNYERAKQNLDAAISEEIKVMSSGNLPSQEQIKAVNKASEAFLQARAATVRVNGNTETPEQADKALKEWTDLYIAQAKAKYAVPAGATGVAPAPLPPASAPVQQQGSNGASRPVAAAAPATVPAPAQRSGQAPSGDMTLGGVYHVAQGDTLSGIAATLTANLSTPASMSKQDTNLAVAAVIAAKNGVSSIDRIGANTDLVMPTAEELRAGLNALAQKGIIDQNGRTNYAALRDADVTTLIPNVARTAATGQTQVKA